MSWINEVYKKCVNARRTMDMGRKMIVSIGVVAALAVFFCVGWWLGRSTERGEAMTWESGDSKQTERM
nr:hypothetical protein [uncultured Acetatifactor sp.]